MGLFENDEEYKKDLERKKAKKADMMGSWVMVLFRLQIVAIVGSVMSSDLFEKVPLIYYLGTLMNFGILIANSVILIRLKEVEDWFGKAGICYLVSGCSGIVIVLLALGGAGVLGGILTIAMAIVELVGNYDECTGYEVSLQDIDEDLSVQWSAQWKLELICILSTLGLTILSLIGAALLSMGVLVLCIILMLIVGVASIVVGIRRLIYLHRTAVCFQNYVPDEVVE
ncbi:MAG: hypothetical protein IKT67_00675 [Lachnospiraceae bacterium]|nr:hypothetical protein [Lachnospiraceae bacterium]